MKKQIILTSLATLALAGCSDNEFLGNEDAQHAQKGETQISFATGTSGLTRADHVGADAALLLNSNFVVMGTKGGTIGTPSSIVTTTVFDHYNVNWKNNTAGTTASNTHDWEYVGETPHTYATANGITGQYIKYWDFSAGQYDFIAYSGGTADMITTGTPAAGQLLVTSITPSSATNVENGGAYKVTGATADLAKFYIADLVTVPQSDFGKVVLIKFRNISAKVRVGIYETVPGYSIRDVEFYASDDATTPVASNVLTLYSQSANIYSDGTYTVYYPTVNKNGADTDNNKAHVSFAASASGAAKISSYAALDYKNAKSIEGSSVNYLGEASNSATFVKYTDSDPYTSVLPNESATALTLRCNYTLVSNDGSKETITVWGAKAVVPAQYCQWQSNYAYTYLFKISDKTNGQTQGLGLGAVGLTPITFDAVVVATEDGLQETVTTVGTPSITTYMKEAPNATTNNEYPAGKTIYVMVQNGADIKTLSTAGQLYTVEGATDAVPATEANVMDALNMNNGATPLVGRNGLTLTTATSDATITAIPGVNGNDITVTEGQAASFTGATGKTYAYVYTVSTGTASEYYSAITIAKGEDAKGYYTLADVNGVMTYTEVTTSTIVTEEGGKIYYQKHTNNNNVYAVKVIKVAE